MKYSLRNSLTKQLFVFSFGILMSLLMAFLVTNRFVKNSMKRNILDLNEKILGQISGNLQDYSDSLNHIAMALTYSPTTKIYFGESRLEQVVEMHNLEKVFANIMPLDEDIAGVGLYDMDMNRTAAMGKQPVSEIFPDKPVEKMQFSDLFYPRKTKVAHYACFYPVFDLDGQRYEQQIGMMVLVMRVDGLQNFLLNTEITENTELYLLDGESKIIADSKKTKAGTFFEYDYESDSHYLVQEMDTAMGNWSVLSRIPQKELYAGTDGSMRLVTIAYGIAGILLCAFTYFCYLNLSRRIYQVDQFIRNIVKEPDGRMEEAREDEIGRVIHSLNRMLDDKERMNWEIQESQRKMYESKIAEKQMQIIAYRNQVNPHFLYNTFECIRGMALYYGTDEIAEITMALSKVFRFAVKGNNIVTLGEEIEYIREYATIIEYRFMGKIEVEIEVDEGLYSKKVIKLILQPLVENAVVHGLEQKIEDGEVRVRVQKKWDNFIAFFVEDNGCGMEEEKVQQLHDSLQAGKELTGVGLANIYQRLKLFYGEEVVFEIKSRLGEGTRFMIVVPDHVEEQNGYA
ncbi:MAG: sensor histidine kinase [Eubacterium sp.]|nr:sensor histidine kinase [Eubacterium sp.]